MRIVLSFVLAALAFNVVTALPARSPNDDAEVIDVPQRPRDTSVGYPGFDGVIDTGAGYPFFQPNPTSFAYNLGFFDAFEDLLRRFRIILSAQPEESDEETTTGLENAFKNGNTTHTVKVIDGHKVEINETVYGDENTLFKVRIASIHPLDDTLGTDEVRPVTSGPVHSDREDEDKEGRREPLADKNESSNEIRGNIDEVK